MAHHAPLIHLVERSRSKNEDWSLFHSDYFNDCNPIDEDEISTELLTILENLEQQEIFTFFYNTVAICNQFIERIKHGKEYPEPLIMFYKNKFYEHLPLLTSDRQKFESLFYDALKHDRKQEFLLIKLKKCLEAGQIEQFKKLCSKLTLSHMDKNPHFDQFQNVTKAKSYLDKIQTFHTEGHTQKESHQQNINSIDDQKCDWILNLWIGANIDSGKLSDILKTLKSRLEKEYSADIHRLALKLASIIAEKKEMVPLSYGIWPLPEDLAMLTKHMKNDDSSEEHTELWLEKVAAMLDDPNADDEKWLILRKVLLHLIKEDSMPETEIASRIFHKVFDEMRAKVWWKMHFKQHPRRDEFTYDKFVDELWTKLNGDSGDNPVLESYIERYLWISKGIEPKENGAEEMVLPAKVVSNLSLTRKQSKLIPNFHRQIHMNLPKDIGLLANVAYKDDIIKLHIVLKYLQQNYFTREEITKSVKFPFSKENLDVAYQVLKNNKKETYSTRIQNILSEFNAAQRSSPLNIMYETDFTRIGVMCQHFKYSGGRKVFSDDILAKLLTLQSYSGFKSIRTVEGRSRNNALKYLRQSIRRTAIFQPISKKMEHIKTSIESISEEWGIPQDILNKVLSKFEDLVFRKCVPLKWAIEKISTYDRGYDFLLDYAVHVEEFLKCHFDPKTLYNDIYFDHV